MNKLLGALLLGLAISACGGAEPDPAECSDQLLQCLFLPRTCPAGPGSSPDCPDLNECYDAFAICHGVAPQGPG